MTNLEIQACYAIKALAQHAERIATALEAIAKKLDKIEKPSTYFTPKEALDVVTANPPMGEVE